MQTILAAILYFASPFVCFLGVMVVLSIAVKLADLLKIPVQKIQKRRLTK